MPTKPRLLIIEDEPAILSGLVDVFVFHGYDVESVTDGQQGLDMAIRGNYDLLLLDVMLPSLDGFSVCNKLREHDCEQPIIMLTAKTSDEDIITGLALGADDYVAKPFSVRELVLRVESVLRRSRRYNAKQAILTIGPVQIDTYNLQGSGLSTSASPLKFTRREVDILQYLYDHRERPVAREELLKEVWGYQQPSSIETRTVDIHIAKLRRKIEGNPKDPQYLVTQRGEGYRLLCSE